MRHAESYNEARALVRQATAGLGLVTLAFGVGPLLAPGIFARVFGFKAPDAATASMMRSLGVRDVVMGMGMYSAAAHGGNFAPWLLARTLTDGGDTAAVALAAARGERHPRFLALGGLALGAALTDATLYLLARRLHR